MQLLSGKMQLSVCLDLGCRLRSMASQEPLLHKSIQLNTPMKCHPLEKVFYSFSIFSFMSQLLIDFRAAAHLSDTTATPQVS